MVDLFSTRFMMTVVEQLFPAKTFLRDMFFKEIKTSEAETVDIDIVKGKRKLAPFVSPLMEGKLVERLGFTTHSIKPAYVKPKMVTTAEDLLKRLPGQTIYGANVSAADRAAQILTADIAEMSDQITRREEWMASCILNAGTVTCTGDGINIAVDYLMAADHKITLTGANLWTATTSDPLGDLLDWKRLIQKDSGLVPDVVVMGATAYKAFINHAKVNEQLNYRRIDLGVINPSALPNGAVYCGYLQSMQLDVYTYDEYYLNDSSVLTPMMPINKVWMGSTRARMVRHYGMIRDMAALYAVPRFPKSWTVEDPSARFVMVQSAPLLAMHQPDAFISAVATA
jgi:hypothetical protein